MASYLGFKTIENVEMKRGFFVQWKEHNIFYAEKWLKILEQPLCVLLELSTSGLN